MCRLAGRQCARHARALSHANVMCCPNLQIRSDSFIFIMMLAENRNRTHLPILLPISSTSYSSSSSFLLLALFLIFDLYARIFKTLAQKELSKTDGWPLRKIVFLNTNWLLFSVLFSCYYRRPYLSSQNIYSFTHKTPPFYFFLNWFEGQLL